MNYEGAEFVDNRPKVLHEGKYRLYELMDGTLHLVYKPSDAEKELHLEIPGKLLRLAKSAADGNMSPIDMMKAAAGFMGGGGFGG